MGRRLGPLSALTVLVAGHGVTGRAVARVLRTRVARVVTLDAGDPEADLASITAEQVAEVDVVVASPGWRPTSQVFLDAAAAGVPVWSEVELAWRLRVPTTATGEPAPWLALTGTNGKTTTVEMLLSILEADGRRAAAVGNVGRPLVEAVVDPSLEVLAIELSSFQLHFTTSMSPLVGAVLNVAPDHLDWHGTYEEYVAAKGKVYHQAQVACVYNVADPVTEDLVREADVVEGARAVGVGVGAPGRSGLGLVEGVLCDRAFHAPADDPARHTTAAELASLDDLGHLAGPDGAVPSHVVFDALAAAAMARAYGVAARSVRDGLKGFRPGAHRIETVAQVPALVGDGGDGGVGTVTFVDDSKATNAHAAAASLGGFAAGTVVWVAGGLTKGAAFDDLVRARADRLRAVVLVGVDRTDLREALARHAGEVPVVEVDPGDTGTVMQRAVETAHGLAQPGDTVLLAPACASMDQFASYAARGDAFAAESRLLAERGGDRR